MKRRVDASQDTLSPTFSLARDIPFTLMGLELQCRGTSSPPGVTPRPFEMPGESNYFNRIICITVGAFSFLF